MSHARTMRSKGEGMAVDIGHAAASFAVRVLGESGAGPELASGLPDLAAATDFAVDWLDREDPRREGSVHLVIVRVDDAGVHTVLTYPADAPSRSPGLVAVFGFDPTTWQPHELNRPPKDELRRRLPSSPRPAAPPSSAPPSVDAQVDAEPLKLEPRTRDWLELLRGAVAIIRSSWGDRYSRVFLVIMALSMWFALTRLGPVFAVISLGMLAALWVRRRQLEGVEPDEDADPLKPEATTRDWSELLRGAVAIIRSSWGDRYSRVFLVIMALSMWFALTLFEPVFAVISLGMLAALWVRRRQLEGVEPDDDFDF